MNDLKKIGLDAILSERIGAWLQEPYDQETIAQVRQMLEDQDIPALTDAFYKDLEFGTGGLRGIVGVGINRMNRYTVARATQGFSNYLLKLYPGEAIRVAISYDSRHMSDVFARLTAEVFAANGIEVYLFGALRPTPQLSFAIRHLQCHGGVMLTASHNPREYNGYKAYGKDGGQLVAPHDKGVICEVLALKDASEVRVYPSDQAAPIHLLGEEMDEAYLRACQRLSLRPDLVQEQANLSMVYSPIHGTGITLVPELLRRWGFENCRVVEAQAQPNGDFPTVVYPNPEEVEAMTLTIACAKDNQAELAMATDPDSDRVGLAIRTENGEYQLLNGNEIGSLLVDYVLSQYREQGLLRPGDYIVKTIVTTNLIKEIAASYQVPCEEVLTGFKYIGELMTQRAEQGHQRFLVGGEESFGYLIGELVRDKDAVLSCAFIAEMAAYHRSQGRTLRQALLSLYQKHGFFKEKLISLTKQGKAGAEAIAKMMEQLRAQAPRAIGGVDVARVNDYKSQIAEDLLNGERTTIDLPQSDVLQFITVDGDVVSIRPSGTEPKIKFYCSVREPLIELERSEEIAQALDEKIDRIMASILKFAEV